MRPEKDMSVLELVHSATKRSAVARGISACVQAGQDPLHVLASLAVQDGLAARIALGEAGAGVVGDERELDAAEHPEQLRKISHTALDVLLRHEGIDPQFAGR